MEYTSNFHDKGSIEKRMLKFATSYLGISNVDLLDPTIKLLVDALAEEVYRISGEIENIEDRLLEKLSGILTSKLAVIPAPAHAILHARSLEFYTAVNKQTGFEYVRNHLKSSGKREHLSFYPVCNTSVYNGDIRYLVSNGLFYQLDSDQTKTLLARPRSRDWTDTSSFWIGLELAEEIDNLKNISFYVNFASVEHKVEYLNLLPYTQWTLADQPIVIEKGIHTNVQIYANNEQELFSNFETTTILDKRILDKYEVHYVHISQEVNIQGLRQVFPEELKKDYLEKFSADFDQPLLWIKVDCEGTIPSQYIDQIQISINTFPVSNKRLCSSVRELNEMSQIVPLVTEDHEFFIAIESLVDSFGAIYSELPFNDTEQVSYKTYSLRRGGFERFGIREGRDALRKTVESLMAQTAEAHTGNDDLNERRDQANRILRIIVEMRRVASAIHEHREKNTYIMLDEFDGKKRLFLKYWLSCCDRANDITSGANLQSMHELAIRPESVHLLTTTTGGTLPPKEEERKQMYREVINERHIIVTKEDILLFCKTNFKDTIKKVELREGVVCSSIPKEDLIRTIDVYLTPKDEFRALFKHSNSGNEFKEKLEKHSPQVYNYRVIMNL